MFQIELKPCPHEDEPDHWEVTIEQGVGRIAGLVTQGAPPETNLSDFRVEDGPDMLPVSSRGDTVPADLYDSGKDILGGLGRVDPIHAGQRIHISVHGPLDTIHVLLG